VTGALIHAHSVMGTMFRNLNLNTNSGAPPAACIKLNDGNTNQLEHITCAGGFSGGNPHPALVGIQLQDEVEDTILKPRIEEITNDGIRISHASGTACGGSKIISGTSEGNGANLTITAGCAGTNIDTVDLEAPVGKYAVVDGGSFNRYISTGPDQTHFLSTSRYNVIDGGTISGVTIDAGAVGNKVTHASFCNNTQPGWLNNGTASELLHNTCANGGNAYPDIYGSPSTVIPSGINVVRETGVNNAIAGKFTPMRTDGGILAETQTCSPLNDGTEFNIQLAHSLQAGANTFNFCGLGAMPIKKASDPAKNIAGYPAGAIIKLRWLADSAVFVDPGLSDSPAFSGLTVNGNAAIGDRGAGSLISLYTSPHGLTSGADFNWATGGGANNAITASVHDDKDAPIVVNRGTPVNLVLGFSLRAGANTFSLNGGPALPILSARTLREITNPASAGAHIRLSYDDIARAWLDMSQ
ncbi:MAG: hypothetical protein M3N54_08615, partial [Acidobacteriota bacterium]|nr:hypothetical protein [Acidobacteriota bacterium]